MFEVYFNVIWYLINSDKIKFILYEKLLNSIVLYNEVNKI